MSDTRPNILLITTDQQRFDTINREGNPSIFTPHLNYLGETGITFTNAYADCPVCMPSRATIMSGRHAYKQGLVDNGKKQVIDPRYSMPGILTQAGYQTRAIGKMHFVPPRNHNGFEHMEILNDYYRWMEKMGHPQKPMDHGLGQNEMEPAISTVPESLSLTRWIVDRSQEFLETRDTTRPFFLWTSFSKPHSPYDPDRNYWDIYDGISMPDPVYGDWSESEEEIPGSFKEASDVFTGIRHLSKEQIRNARRAYYACVSQVDYNLGYLLSYMKENNLFENTLIIYTSDHGDLLGDHHMGFKSNFLEGSAHVPMLMHCPDSLGLSEMSGERCDEIVCLADLITTFASAAGIELSDNWEYDGLDLRKVAAGDSKRESLVGSCGDQFHMILKDGFKYHVCIKGGAELLFDLNQDPYEETNLAENPEFAEKKADLRSAMIESLKDAEADYVKNGELVIKDWVHNKHRNPGLHTRRWPSDLTH